jgi:hypothetical protein
VSYRVPYEDEQPMTPPTPASQDAATDEDGVTRTVLFTGLILLAGPVLLFFLGTILVMA